MAKKIIRYYAEGDNPFYKYVFNFIFTSLGFKGVTCKNNGEIFYGKNISKNFKINIASNDKHIIWQDLIDGKIKPSDIKQSIPFDLIGAIGKFLTDEPNKALLASSFDQYGRLKFKYSFQYKKSIHQIPIVNLYLDFLKKIIKLRLRKEGLSLWPKGKKCAIGLSHDVDFLEKYDILKLPISKNQKKPIGKLRFLSCQIFNKFKCSIEGNKNNYWLFEQVMDYEQKLGFKSTFFFTAINQSERYSSQYDTFYDITILRNKKLLNNIVARGFELGLHASYNAFLKNNYLIREKDKIQKITNCSIKGLRHHFWHLGNNEEKTLALHEIAKFRYDSSLAFNDGIGFRRNVALAYFPWSEKSNRPLKVRQLPVFCMDGNLFYQSVELETALERLKELTGTIRMLNGLGVIDWHAHTSFPYNQDYFKWGLCYLNFLNFLANNSDIWVTNLGEINKWLDDRMKLLNNNY